MLALTMGKLENKFALITGGNSGIGLASARLFVNEGARVAISGRNEKTLRSAADSLPRFKYQNRFSGLCKFVCRRKSCHTGSHDDD